MNLQLHQDEINNQKYYGEQSDACRNNETVHNSESTHSIDNQHDLIIIHTNDVLPDEMQKKHIASTDILKIDQTLDKVQYDGSISFNAEDHHSKKANIERRSSFRINHDNKKYNSKKYVYTKTISLNIVKTIIHCQSNPLPTVMITITMD